MPFLSQATMIPQTYSFTPCQIPGCVLWVPVDQLAYSNTNSVGAAQDFSGHGNNLSQATGGDQPEFLTGQINGLPALSFNGTSDLLVAANGFVWGAAGFSMFVVASVPSVSAGNHPFITDATNGGNYLEVVSTTYRLVVGGGVIAQPYSLRSTWSVFDGVGNVNPGVTAIYINGVLQNSSTGFTSSAVSGFSIGANYNNGTPNSYADCSIAEVIVYNTALTSAQRYAVEGYLGYKYAIHTVQN